MEDDRLGEFYTKILKFDGADPKKAAKETTESHMKQAIEAIRSCDDFTLFTRKGTTSTTHGFAYSLPGVVSAVCACLHFTKAIVTQLEPHQKAMLLDALNQLNARLNERYGKENDLSL